MDNISRAGAEPHPGDLLSPSKHLADNLVPHNRCLDVHREVADLETRLHLEYVKKMRARMKAGGTGMEMDLRRRTRIMLMWVKLTWKQTSSEVGSMSQPSLLGLIRTVLLPNQVTMSMTGLALRMTTVSLSYAPTSRSVWLLKSMSRPPARE